MPQHLLLEGSDIDELLLRVQSEHGPDVTIVRAEQKLVGGVAGFFARRRYELAVQVEDPDVDPEPTGGRPGGPASFDDLLDRADSADAGPGARGEEPTGTGRLPTQRGRRLSTQTPQFESLLNSLVSRAERVEAGPPVSPGSPASTAALPREVATSTPAAVTAPPTRAPSAPSAPSAPLQPRGRTDGGGPDIAAAVAATTGTTGSTAWDRVLMGRADRWATPVAGPSPAPAGPLSPPDRRESDSTAATAALVALGLPAGRLPEQLASDPRVALLDLLGGLAAPAPGRLWGVTVVVGPRGLAHRAADAIVEDAGGNGDDVIVTTSGAPSAAEPAVRASALVTVNGSAVVVIETPATRAAARRAGRLTAGLGLGTVVAAIDATRERDATREWLAELGGSGRPVDQLAAFEVAESPTPLGLLGLGVDVAWLDGCPAGVGAWAAPCLDRWPIGAVRAG